MSGKVIREGHVYVYTVFAMERLNALEETFLPLCAGSVP
jgi:hypothetical protein